MWMKVCVWCQEGVREFWLIGLGSTFPLDKRLCDEVGTMLNFLLSLSGSLVTLTGLCKCSMDRSLVWSGGESYRYWNMISWLGEDRDSLESFGGGFWNDPKHQSLWDCQIKLRLRHWLFLFFILFLVYLCCICVFACFFMSVSSHVCVSGGSDLWCLNFTIEPSPQPLRHQHSWDKKSHLLCTQDPYAHQFPQYFKPLVAWQLNSTPYWYEAMQGNIEVGVGLGLEP